MTLSKNNRITPENMIIDNELYTNQLLNLLPVAVYTCNSEGYIQTYNKASVDLWGREPEVGIDLWSSFWENFTSTGLPLAINDCAIAIALKYGRIISSEIVIKKTNGEIRNIIPYPQPIYDKNGEIIGAINTLIDITEQVNSRKMVEETELENSLAIEAAELETFDWNLQTHNFKSSAKLISIFGFNNIQSVSHQNLINTFHPNDKHIRLKAITDAQIKGTLQYEARIIWNDKSIHWIKVYGKIFFNEKQEPLRMCGTVEDITEQITLENKLRKSAERFQLLADSMPQFVWTADELGNLNYFNKAVYDYSGLNEETIQQQGWLTIVHPDDREENKIKWQHSITTGEDFYNEHRFCKYDGTYRWQLSRAIAEKDTEGKILMWIGTSTDIDEYKNFASELENKVKERTEDLIKQNQFTQTILDSSVDSVMVIDIDEVVISLNKTANDFFFPYFSESIIGKTLEQIDPAIKSKPDWKYTSAALNGEFTCRKDVKSEIDERYFDIYYIPLKKESITYAIMLIIREVTEAVFAKSEIEKTNSLLSDAQRLAQIGSWDWDVLKNEISWTDELYRIFGVSKDTFKSNFKNYLNCIHSSDRKFVAYKIQEAMNTHKPFDFHHRIVHNDGTIKTIHGKGEIFINNNNEVIRLSGTAQDVTESIELENKLKHSEMRHHLMTEQIEDYAIIFLNPQGNIEDWNKGAEKIKGYTGAEIIGKHFSVFYPEEERSKKIPEKILKEAKKNKNSTYEGWRVRKDGAQFWASVVITAIIDNNNDLIGFSKLTRDLTEQKIAEEEINKYTQKIIQQNLQLETINKDLANQKAFADSLIENSPLMILAYDKNMKITTWNKKSEEYHNLKKEDVLEKTTFEVFHKKINENWINSMSEVLKFGKPLHYPKVQLKHESGWGEIFVVPLHDPQNQIIGGLSITKEITELMKMTSDLEMKNQELESSNKELASFSYIASHDLQEPLRKISTFTSRLKEKYKDQLSNDIQWYIEKIETSSKRMATLIQDLLNYSRLSDSEKLFEQVDLNLTLKNVLNDFELLIEQKKAKIKIDKLPILDALPLQMNQLFFNLISNALKFSKTDVPVILNISARKISDKEIKKYPELMKSKNAKGYYELIFKDNGIGFNQKYAEQIFIIFKRLHTRTEYIGTGIGLGLSKKIVENHNGEIFCESIENVGSTFHIILPIKHT